MWTQMTDPLRSASSMSETHCSVLLFLCFLLLVLLATMSCWSISATITTCQLSYKPLGRHPNAAALTLDCLFARCAWSFHNSSNLAIVASLFWPWATLDIALTRSSKSARKPESVVSQKSSKTRDSTSNRQLVQRFSEIETEWEETDSNSAWQQNTSTKEFSSTHSLVSCQILRSVLCLARPLASSSLSFRHQQRSTLLVHLCFGLDLVLRSNELID